MKRTHLLSTAAALAGALLAAPAAVLAQRGGSPAWAGDAPSATPAGSAQNRATAEADRSEGGPAELLRMAQRPSAAGRRRKPTSCWSAPKPASSWCVPAAARRGARLRRGRTGPAHRRSAPRAGQPRPGRSDAAHQPGHRHHPRREQCDGQRPGPLRRPRRRRWSGMVESGMSPTSGGGRAVLRDGGTGGVSVTRAEGASSSPRPAPAPPRRRRRWHRHHRPAARRYPPRLVRHPRRGRAGGTRRLRNPAPRSDAGLRSPIPPSAAMRAPAG